MIEFESAVVVRPGTPTGPTVSLVSVPSQCAVGGSGEARRRWQTSSSFWAVRQGHKMGRARGVGGGDARRARRESRSPEDTKDRTCRPGVPPATDGRGGKRRRRSRAQSVAYGPTRFLASSCAARARNATLHASHRRSSPIRCAPARPTDRTLARRRLAPSQRPRPNALSRTWLPSPPRT